MYSIIEPRPVGSAALRLADLEIGQLALHVFARRIAPLIDTGADPLGAFEAARAAPTVAELADKFEKEHLPRKREGTRLAYQRTLNKYIRPHFGLHTKVTDVAFANIDALHQRITTTAGPSAANRTTAILSKMFSLAIRWQCELIIR